MKRFYVFVKDPAGAPPFLRMKAETFRTIGPWLHFMVGDSVIYAIRKSAAKFVTSNGETLWSNETDDKVANGKDGYQEYLEREASDIVAGINKKIDRIEFILEEQLKHTRPDHIREMLEDKFGG